ncbi:MAG: Calx-beta domain-containing protein, partial [Pseudomonadota bacterium]
MLKKLHKLCYSLILTLPTLVQAATDCSAVTQIPSTECEALVALYNSTNGDGWKYNSEWLETNTPCSWERVSCTSGHVSELYLHSNQLTGTIPSELGNLSYLEYLYLHSNQLTGTIPSELGNLSKLTRLYLSSNQLTGTIPSELGNLSKLTKLNLSDNKLTGSIPSNLPSGTLNVLNLSDNRLTGTIPTLSGLIALTEINLSQNLLTGSFPDRLNSLAGLKTLLLNDNGLCGEIPTNLIDSTASPVSPITQLQLENNHLTANDATLRQWLMNLNPTWESSQTLCTAGTLQFSSAKDSIGESDGSISITVSRVESNAGDVSVMYISEDVTATGAGVDYATVAGILTWTDKASNDQIVTVNITDDSINEDEETFKLKLLNAIGGATIGEPATAEVTIIDDDDEEGTLQFSSATYNVNETGGTITVTVKRINDKEGAISVTYTSSDDTAMAWNDYTPTAGTLNWNNGDTSDKTFTVSITDDAIFEGDETFNLTLSNATGGATIGEPSTAVVTIIDDEKPPKGTLQFSSATYNVNETGGTITIPVKRINSKEGDISVMYVTDNGTATAGNDYTPTIGTLNWNNGDTSDKTFTVTIIDDAIFEGDETFKLMLSNATGGATIGEPSTAVVTIIDNESVLLQFSEAEYEIKENVESVIFPIRRTGESDGAVSIDYATSDDTAKAGIDYTETTGTCSWDGGDNSDCEDFQVSINNDDESEDNETFIVSIGNPTGGAQTGTPDTATVMIVDNDTAFNCKKVTSIPKKECQALVAFYDNTDGDNWENSEGWFETNTPCSWNGVTCSGEHVSELSLPGNELTGKFPKKLNKLNKLEKLDLSYNSLTGKIPDLGKMKNLTELALDHNELEGEIPKQLGNLKNLTGLALSVNILDGKIPKELSNLKKLEWLLLDHNMLDSNIPKELGDLTNLKRLDLDYNHFTESIPDELGKLTKLKRLSLANNQLTGSIPKALGNLEELKFLALWRNQLTGEIPSELSNLSKLETLELQYNQLTGTIPGELGDLSRLSYIQLRDNELRGEIPTELKELLIPVKPNPVYLKLDNNHLTATDQELIDWLDEHNPDWETTQRFP